MSTGINILIRMPNWLGDCVMAMPALRHLHETLPGAAIHLSGRGAFRGLLSAQTGVAGFVEAPDSGFGKLIRGMSDTRRIVRDTPLERRIDLGILLTNSLSTAAWMWRVGAGVRIGYDLDCRRFFLTHPVPCGGMEQSWHFIKYYLWLAQTAESVVAEETGIRRRGVESLNEFLVPELNVGGCAREEADALLRDAGVSGDYVVIAPASAYGAVKDWPPSHYRRLVEIINRDLDLPAVITGGARQRDVCAEIARGRKAAFNLAGSTSLESFVGLLAGAALFIGGDSGGAHAAAALGIPTAVIFGITNPARTRPIGRRVVCLGFGEDRDVKLNTPAARRAARTALEAIRPERVFESAREAMERRERPADTRVVLLGEK